MYTFKFFYENNSYQEFFHISKVEYCTVIDYVVSDNEILQHCFPTGYDMYLFAEGANYTASGRNLKSISVCMEE